MDKLIDKIKILNKFENVKDKKIVLFGAGLEGQIAYEYFKSKEINIDFYCDNNKVKQNTRKNGIKIISVEDLSSMDNILVFITVKVKVNEIKSQLEKIGIEYVVFSEYIMQLDFKANIDKYLYVYNNLLNDNKSKEVYKAVLESRLSGDLSYIKNVYDDNPFYSLLEFRYISDEYFVDAGAYVGDTLEKFIWNCTGVFKKIYAFEPGIKQFNSMCFRVDRLKKEWGLQDTQIECINAGLGETDTILPLFEDEQNLLTSNFICNNSDKKTNEVKVYSLDSYLKSKKITMMKADIEGFEMEMLKGSKGIIKNQKPKLAISVYHKYEDLFEIPIYINKIMPEYKMEIRHHSSNLSETVLYCWVD